MKPKPLDLEQIGILNKKGNLDFVTLGARAGRIKSACEFYLRYKDNPELLVKEHSEYEKEIKREFYSRPIKTRRTETAGYYFIIDYNEWLFKVAFKDVLKERGKE